MTDTVVMANAGGDGLAELRQTLRVFISSPGDSLGPERARALDVIHNIRDAYRKIIRLEVLFWEEYTYRADRAYVDQIPEARTYDAVVCIFWDSIGRSPIPPSARRRPDSDEPYESGTVYEFETARAEAIRTGGRPAVFLFRKTAPVVWPSDKDRIEEKKLRFDQLTQFWSRWVQRPDGSFLSAYEPFVTLDEFAARLHKALTENWLFGTLGISTDAVRWDVTRDGSPFRGLAPFDPAHHRVFHGRDAAIARVIRWLRDASDRGAPPYFLIRGASGSGKSSLIRAGVMPLLAANSGSETWLAADMRPGLAPLSQLAETICSALGGAYPGGATTLEPIMRAAPEGAAQQVAAILAQQAGVRRHAEQRDGEIRGRIFLLIDQLEEAASQSPDPGAPPADAETAFAKAVQALCMSGAVWVTATLRSDLEPALLRSPLRPLADPGAWGGGSMPLAPPDAIADIIEGPAEMAGLRFESRGPHSLADEIRADLEGQTDALPLLQMTLERLFERDIINGARELTFASYESIGRLSGAIASKADNVVAALPGPVREQLDDLLRDLVRGSLQAGQIVSRSVKLSGPRSSPPRRALIEALAGPAARLLVIEGDEVHVAHEALLRGWPRARAVVDDEARFKDLCRQLDEATRQVELITPGPLLSKARDSLERLRPEPSMKAVVALVERSLGKEAKDLADERRRRRWFQALSAALAVLAVLAAGAAWQAYQEARTAETELSAAGKVAGLLTGDVERSLRERASASVVTRSQLLLATERALADLQNVAGDKPDLLFLSARLNLEKAEEQRLGGETQLAVASVAKAADQISHAVSPNIPGQELLATRRDILLAEGELALETEDYDRSQVAFDAATKLAEEIPRGPSADIGAIRALARALWDSGDLLWRKSDNASGAEAEADLRRAEDFYQRAVGTLRPIGEDGNGDPLAQTDYIQARERVADIRLDNDSAAALRIYRENLEKAERLAVSPVAEPALQASLSVSREHLANALLEATPPNDDEALALYQKDLATREKLHEQDAANGKLYRNLAVLHHHIAFALLQKGNTGEARKEYAAASRIFDDLAAKDPGDPRSLRDAVEEHIDYANVLAGLPDCGASLTQYQVAEELLARPSPAGSDPFAEDHARLHDRRGELEQKCGIEPQAAVQH